MSANCFRFTLAFDNRDIQKHCLIKIGSELKMMNRHFRDQMYPGSSISPVQNSLDLNLEVAGDG